MKRIACIVLTIFVALIALLESSGKNRRHPGFMEHRETDDDVWLGN